ncbi:MAG: hypothetical protein KDA22_14735 [Phycisphaerales bacterium]|nr:hypothetical protein [Phycisphaerales bacterium]
MDPAILRQLALGAIPPAIAGALVLGALVVRHEDTLCRRLLRALPALVVGCGVLGMHALLFGPPVFPATSALGWLPWLTLGVGAAAFGAALPKRGRALLLAAVVLIGLAVGAWLSARTLLANAWDARSAAGHLGAMAAGAALFVGGLLVVLRLPGAVGLLGACMTLGGASQLAVLGHHSLTIGQFVGIFAAFCGGGVVAALVRRNVRLGSAATITIGVATALASFQAFLYGDAEHPVPVAIATAVLPWAVWGLLVAATGAWRRLRRPRVE